MTSRTADIYIYINIHSNLTFYTRKEYVKWSTKILGNLYIFVDILSDENCIFHAFRASNNRFRIFQAQTWATWSWQQWRMKVTRVPFIKLMDCVPTVTGFGQPQLTQHIREYR